MAIITLSSVDDCIAALHVVGLRVFRFTPWSMDIPEGLTALSEKYPDIKFYTFSTEDLTDEEDANIFYDCFGFGDVPNVTICKSGKCVEIIAGEMENMDDLIETTERMIQIHH
ncbi:uncharacterized protein N7482_003912 [Penicillium canariense]|uniref:Thioredoxin domain-containing protein n=1 Tax=Penicillium canariense TaxID=189055 RepID=A0A9W9I7M7_9EURO|nr:uncharacterized protein N7482_003912 [Penicillium canariense]KAJ5168318.1 hypothetical protein N7482_003912 [Penicillium canariense]